MAMHCYFLLNIEYGASQLVTILQYPMMFSCLPKPQIFYSLLVQTCNYVSMPGQEISGHSSVKSEDFGTSVSVTISDVTIIDIVII